MGFAGLPSVEQLDREWGFGVAGWEGAAVLQGLRRGGGGNGAGETEVGGFFGQDPEGVEGGESMGG